MSISTDKFQVLAAIAPSVTKVDDTNAASKQKQADESESALEAMLVQAKGDLDTSLEEQKIISDATTKSLELRGAVLDIADVKVKTEQSRSMEASLILTIKQFLNNQVLPTNFSHMAQIGAETQKIVAAKIANLEQSVAVLTGVSSDIENARASLLRFTDEYHVYAERAQKKVDEAR
jgi:hypothetical protein